MNRCELCNSMMVGGVCQNCGTELDYDVKENNNEGYLFYNDSDLEEAGFDIFEPELQVEFVETDEPSDAELDQIEKELGNE